MKKLKNEELGRLSVSEFKESKKIPVVIVLDNIRSMNNIGSAFRTGDAFIVEKILLCGITAKPPHRDIQKTALGATESVEWTHFENTEEAVGKLQEEGYTVISIEQAEESQELQNFHFGNSSKYALVFGNEVFGVQEGVMKLVDDCIEIPQYGTKHSLNISVSLGIVLWEFSKNLQITIKK